MPIKINGKIAIFFLFAIFIVTFSFMVVVLDNVVVSGNFLSRNHGNSQMQHKIEQENNIYFSKVTYAKPVFLSKESLDVQIEIHNPSNTTETLWLGYSLLNPLEEWLDLPMKKVVLPKNQTTIVSISTKKDDLKFKNLVSGSYTGVFALWDTFPISDTSNRLAETRLQDAFRIYNDVETFDSFNTNLWFIRSGKLGRSRLTPPNVKIENGQLSIMLPAGTLQGGELQSLDKFHYGSYEISMQLPNVPSSITGFFLYKAPDFYHEIDIEIFNKATTEVLFTTYYQGDTYHEAVHPLAFDPTAGFHRYRIDYYPHEVAFYIEDQLIQRWDNGFSHEPMHLIVNAWYPHWLEGTPPPKDEFLNVEWIRY
ncbi:MAG: glycoside hydrolase family 16 protein [Clostridiaceae bacterium]|nr:glycoside hydrolase family 16 protein [Clostridiaceae bacterium]